MVCYTVNTFEIWFVINTFSKWCIINTYAIWFVINTYAIWLLINTFSTWSVLNYICSRVCCTVYSYTVLPLPVLHHKLTLPENLPVTSHILMTRSMNRLNKICPMKGISLIRWLSGSFTRLFEIYLHTKYQFCQHIQMDTRNNDPVYVYVSH